jgi:hypothetical protein
MIVADEMSTVSMSGKSSIRTPDVRRRFGPNQDTGLARSDQIGSVKMLEEPC